MRLTRWCCALLGVALYSQIGSAQKQDLGPRNAGLSLVSYPFSEPLRSFINRQAWPEYWNYGQFSYAPNTVSVRSLEIYDRLGSHLFRGLPLFSWQETRSDSVGLQRSAVDRERFFFTFFNNLLVTTDRYGGWDFGLTLGDAIRTSLTPLTLRDPRWQGIRLDAQAANQGFLILMTRGALARFSAFDARRDLSPVLGYGAHYYYEPNSMVQLGATLFNQHQVDVESSRGSFVGGTQPYQMQAPRQILVQIAPDEPGKGSVAAVYGVDIVVEMVGPDDGDRQIYTSNAAAAEPARYNPALRPRISGGRSAGSHRLVDAGTDPVVYMFDLPQGARMVSAVFRADVAGDYRIGVRQIHDFVTMDGEERVVQVRAWPPPADPTHSQLGNPQYPYDFKPAQDEPYFTVVRAQGQPQLSARRMVSFDYGIPSGKTLLGFDVHIASRELVLDGEVVYNVEESHFPFSNDSLNIRGDRLTVGSWAYMLTATVPWDVKGLDLEWGGEIFRMDPRYSGGYDSRRGGTVFFTDKGGSSGNQAYAQEFPLVIDNDDEDEYPDDSFSDQGRFQPNIPGSYSGGRSGGVFPGLDADGDMAPDNDRDRNGVPDWTEPFLLYDSDPAEFVYGIDFNNNAQPDFRENDDLPDYPIRKDQRGVHSFLGVSDLLPGLRYVAAGYYDIEELAGAGSAGAWYGRLKGRWRPAHSLSLEVDDDVKWVEDDIRDDVYEWSIGDTSALANVNSPLVPPPEDPLVMRRSWVNTASCRLTYQPRVWANVRADLLHFVNAQREISADDTVLQEADTFIEWSAVLRASVERRWRDLSLWAGTKWLLQEGRRGPAWEDASVRLFAPILKASYEILPGMSLEWGTAGIPGLPMRLVDGKDPDRDYEERKAILMFSAHTDNFQGSTVSTHTGVELHSVDFDRGDRIRDFDTFTLFVDLIVGQ